MPRLNNDEQNQAIGMPNAGMSATVVSRHFDCTRKAIERLRRRFVSQETLPTVLEVGDHVDLCCRSSQHLHNRRLTAAATGRQYDIHPHTVRYWLRQNIQPIRAYRPYFGQILTRRL